VSGVLTDGGLGALAAALVGAAAGVGLVLLLRRGAHRRGEERERPPQRLGWVVPVLVVAAWALQRQAGDDATVLVVHGAALVWMAGLAAIDVDVRRLPDTWTGPGALAAVVSLGVAAGLGDDGARWLVAVGCGLVNGAVYLLLALVNPAGLGLGDVKLAVPLGVLVGWWGPVAVVLAFFGAFLVGLVVGLVAAVRTGQGLGATFPFGPAMLASAAVVVVLAA